MFTLCQIVNGQLQDVYPKGFCSIGSTSSGTIFAPKQDCSAPLLKMEHPVSDRFLKRSGPDLNTFVGADIAMEPPIGKW